MKVGALALVLLSAPLAAAGPAGLTPAGRMSVARSVHTATLLPDGRVLMVGGLGVESSSELYDPASGRFSPAAAPLTPRVGQTARPLLHGRVFIAGGWTGEGGRLLASAELYDPRAGRFTRTGSMTVGRGSPTATRLRDGRVLVAGGSGDGTALASAELYDPQTGVFRRTGSMTVARQAHAATRLGDGRVLVLGGSDERDGHGQRASAELFRPATGRFAATGAMRSRRFKLGDAVVVLRDGRVLVAGGSARVEAYDPRRGTFREEAGRIDAARNFATATLLRDGRVLVAGGYDDRIRSTAAAWLFTP
jgi:hypothetical protein